MSRQSSFKPRGSSSDKPRFNNNSNSNRDRPRPTHFISLRIKDDEIWKQVDKLQTLIISENSDFQKHCESPNLLHITLFVCTLDQDSIILAKKALVSCQDIFDQFCKDVTK